jgi:hypothetical protein
MKAKYCVLSMLFILMTVGSFGAGIMACGDATTRSQTPIQYPAGTGGITVSLKFPFDEPDHTVTRGLSDFCPEWGYPTVSFEVYASDDSTLLKKDEFSCSHNNGQGTVNGIPMGSGRILYVGILVQEELLFAAKVTGIPVNEGQTTDVGQVELLTVHPGSLEITNSDSYEPISALYFHYASGEFSSFVNELEDVISPGGTETFETIPEGNYTFRVCWETSGCYDFNVSILESEVYSLDVVPPDQKGVLEINSTPAGASIFIDDYDQEDITPYTYIADPGNYTVRLILDGYQDWEQTVEVAAGQTTTVNATLVPVNDENVVYEIEPNNNFDQAQSVELPVKIYGSAKEGDPGMYVDLGEEVIAEDVYLFSLDAEYQVDILLSTNSQADFDLYIANSYGFVHYGSTARSNRDEHLIPSLCCDFYIIIDAYDNMNDVDYTLTVTPQ